MKLEAYRTLARLSARREEWARNGVAAAQASVQAAAAALVEGEAVLRRFADERRRRERTLHADALGRVMGLGELERWRSRCLELAQAQRDHEAAVSAASDRLDHARRELRQALDRWRAAQRAVQTRELLAGRAVADLARAAARRVELELDDRPVGPR